MKYKKTKDVAICAYVKSAENEAQEIPIQMDQLDECERFLISASSVPDSADIVEIKLTFLNATAGDDGYYVVATNESSFLVNFRERDNTDYRTKNICMPILGFKRATDTYLLTVTGMQYSYTLRVHVFEGQYSVSVLYDLQETALYEDVILNVYKIEGVNADYNAIAKKYQELQIQKLNLRPLTERAKTSAVLRYALAGMPVIRVRMAWKPVPTPVLEQTAETEPALHVACTFAQVEELMDHLHECGLERAEICLVGWNYRGHDGRWPQMLPVEPALGGERGLKQLLAHANELGYRVVFHTNSSDAYRISDIWNEDDIVRKKNGELSINDTTWSGGRMYHLCPKCAEEKYLAPVLQKLGEYGAEGFSYIDVLTINPIKECFHSKHLSNAKQSAEHLRNILKKTKETTGGVSSEGGSDFAADCLDYSLYVSFNSLKGVPKIADEVIPLWQLIYHGYILSNPSAETVNYCIKSPENRLRFYEYGGIPTIYYYSKFVSEEKRTNWMGAVDMVIDDTKKMQQSCERIVEMMQEYQIFAPRQMAFMQRHEKLAEGVYQTTYSDGYAVVCNYSDVEYHNGAMSVQPQQVQQIKMT